MKKYVLKKWFENLLTFIACLTFMLIVASVDSEWTTQYLQFFAFNSCLFAFCFYLLKKYKRDKED